MARIDDRIQDIRLECVRAAISINDVAHPYFAVSSVDGMLQVAAALEFYVVHGAKRPAPEAQVA